MTNVQDSISQAERFVKLYGDRLNVLKQLAQLDSQLSGADKEAFVPVAVDGGTQVPEKRGRGRPKGSKNKNAGKNGKPQPKEAPQVPAEAPAQDAAVVEAIDEGRKRFPNKTSLKKLIVKICGRHPSGIKLDELVKKCYESGYRSTSGEKGFVQNIRTNLHTLLNNGIVVRDEDKKYHKQGELEEVPEAVV